MREAVDVRCETDDARADTLRLSEIVEANPMVIAARARATEAEHILLAAKQAEAEALIAAREAWTAMRECMHAA